MTDKQIDQPHGLGLVEGVSAIAADTMVGDVRDLLLQEARDVRTALPWTSRSEREQREIISKADDFARRLVRKVVTELAGGAQPKVQVMIDSWTVKDGIKIVAKAASTPGNIEALSEGTDAPILVFVRVDDVSGERAPVVPLADQPDLGDGDGPVFDRTPSGRD